MRYEWTEERIRLWNEWLKTEDGKGYEAGWGDDWSRAHADRGRAWVEARIAEGASRERMDK